MRYTPRALYFEIFLASFAGMLFEISYTRIFSFKLFYYFSYVILGLGMLGISAGAIAFSISKRLREADLRKLLPTAAFGGGASALVGYFVIALLPLDIQLAVTSPLEIAKMFAAMACLLCVFSAIGLIASAIFAQRLESVGKLYGTDLLGAALGCGTSIPLLLALTPPRTVFLHGPGLIDGVD